MTIYETASILLEKVDELNGVTLTQPFLYEEEYSVVGPSDSEQRLQLQNGIRPSNNTVFGVLYGEFLLSGNDFLRTKRVFLQRCTRFRLRWQSLLIAGLWMWIFCSLTTQVSISKL